MPSDASPEPIGPARPSFLDRAADLGIVKNMLNHVEDMTAADVEAVAAMHQSEIPGGILTELGPVFLTLLYRQVITDPAADGYVVRKDSRVVGFIVGSTDPAKIFNDLFRRHFIRLGFLLMKKCITRPLFALRFAQRVKANRHKENLPESLAAAVAKDYKKSGYGLILLKRLLDAFRERGVRRVQCDVAIDAGDPGIVTLHQMYRKCGYVENATFRVGKVTYQRYQRDLPKTVTRRGGSPG